jgi:hypothetical protein
LDDRRRRAATEARHPQGGRFISRRARRGGVHDDAVFIVLLNDQLVNDA